MTVMSKPAPTFADTLEVRDACLCLHVQRAARALARRFDQALAPAGLTNGQFSLLMALNRPSPPPISAVAAVLGQDRTTVTAALMPLARRGLVEPFPDPEDRRSRLLRLTDAGTQRLAEALPIWRSEHAAVEAELSSPADGLRFDLVTLSSSFAARPA